ncbi:hypothetical protein ACQPW1_01970 [Nocardia sp. CA-128927]
MSKSDKSARSQRAQWADRVAKWGPLVLAVYRTFRDICDRLHG